MKSFLYSAALCAPWLLSLVLAGCATTPEVNWDSRIGSYTFQQAQKEQGEPDQILRFNDGTFVAEWLQGQTYSGPPTTAASGSYGPRHTWVDREGMESLARAARQTRYLHLTFSAENRLLRWDKGTK